MSTGLNVLWKYTEFASIINNNTTFWTASKEIKYKWRKYKYEWYHFISVDFIWNDNHSNWLRWVHLLDSQSTRLNENSHSTNSRAIRNNATIIQKQIFHTVFDMYIVQCAERFMKTCLAFELAIIIIVQSYIYWCLTIRWIVYAILVWIYSLRTILYGSTENWTFVSRFSFYRQEEKMLISRLEIQLTYSFLEGSCACSYVFFECIEQKWTILKNFRNQHSWIHIWRRAQCLSEVSKYAVHCAMNLIIQTYANWSFRFCVVELKFCVCRLICFCLHKWHSKQAHTNKQASVQLWYSLLTSIFVFCFVLLFINHAIRLGSNNVSSNEYLSCSINLNDNLLWDPLIFLI